MLVAVANVIQWVTLCGFVLNDAHLKVLSLHVAILLSPAGPRPDHSESLHEHS